MLLAIYTSSNNFLSTSKTAFAVVTTIATAANAISEWGLLYVLFFFYTRRLLHKLHYVSYTVLIVSEATTLKGFITLPFVFHSFKKVSGR
jgi:short subunit fatty acids transporter